jgi:hypothetical protein
MPEGGPLQSDPSPDHLECLGELFGGRRTLREITIAHQHRIHFGIVPRDSGPVDRALRRYVRAA